MALAPPFPAFQDFYHKYSNALLSLALFILSQFVADHSIVYANVKSILIQQDEIRDCF